MEQSGGRKARGCVDYRIKGFKKTESFYQLDGCKYLQLIFSPQTSLGMEEKMKE